MENSLCSDSAVEFTLPSRFRSNRRDALRWMISHALRYWWLLFIMVLGAIGNAALAALVPILTGDAFNAMLQPKPDTSVLLPLALIMGGSQIVRAISQWGRNFGAEMMAQRIERDVREELYVSLLGKSMTFHSLQPIGDTMARATNDVREINFMFSPGLNLVVGSLIFLIMPIIYSLRYHASLIATPILFAVFYFLALRHYLRTLDPVTAQVRARFGKMNAHLSETLDGIEIVKSAAQEEAEIQRFNANAHALRESMVKQGDIEARYLPLLLFFLALTAGLGHAMLLYQRGIINLGNVVAYFGILLMLEFPTWTSIWAYSQISLGMAGARRILELMNRQTTLDQNVRGHQGKIQGRVEFRGVWFKYPSREKDAQDADVSDAVLQDISFTVEAGQTVAIVGQTGAGKTTLVKLINRTYDATRGQVLIDGVDVREWNLASLRSQISMIEQDIFLFSRSIAENIAFGRPEATQEEIVAAARAAQAEEFIEQLEQNYQTIIGERGVTLSGGQRQRIAIARAFLSSPRILILDDSTSSIDSATEDRIQQAIAAAARGRTTFIITHRLSQIRWADLILFLRKGRIAAIGTHEDLLETCEAYARLFQE